MNISNMKRISKRLISCMLLVAMFASSFYSVAADVINHDDKGTTIDLLTEVVAKNLSPYGISASAADVQNMLITVGKEEGLASGQYTMTRDGQTVSVNPEEAITKVPVYDIITKFVEKYNDANGWEKDGTVKFMAEPTINFVTYNATNSSTYGGAVMRSDYTYSSAIAEYIREKEPKTAALTDDELAAVISVYVTTPNPAVAMSTLITDVQTKSDQKNSPDTNYNDDEYVVTLAGPHAVTFATYTQKHVIPSGTIFIGTFLIDAMAINDVYYRYAKDSMGQYNQQIMYYKSELDAGHWKDIISAVGLSDILSDAESIQDADLMKYQITCVIGADGIPRYPDDDTEADIFTMCNPYDMASVPELVPLYMLYTHGAVTQDTTDVSSRYAADVLYRFFNYDGVGKNQAQVILRNKAYRDYIHDHPLEAQGLLGTNPIPMNVKPNITEEEIRYVTGLAEKNLQFSANMPQDKARYPGKDKKAFFDQLLAWAEYYTTDHNGRFNARKDSNGIPRPWIIPAEDFVESGWELANRKDTWKNPQSYMYIINGKGNAQGDLAEFVDKWCSDTVITYKTGNNNSEAYYITSANWGKTSPIDLTSAVTGIAYDNGGTVSSGNVSITWGSKWYSFCDLIYRYMDWMKNMYDVRDDVTYEMDEILTELNVLYKKERNTPNTANDPVDHKANADTLMRLMSRVDATRRAEIYYNLVYNEDHNYVVGPTLMYLVGLLQSGEGHLGQNYEFISGAEETNFAAQDAVLSAAEDAVTTCKDKYMEYNALSFSNGSTVIKQKEYELSKIIIDSSDETERLKALNDLAIVYNIDEGAIVNKTEERRLLDELMVTAGNNYAAAIHDVAGEDYRIAAADPASSKGTLKTYLELQKADADGDVAQLQNMIKGYALRLNTSEGTMFINRRLDWAEAQVDDIKLDDPYGKFAQDSLKEHIAWLKEILKAVKNGTLNGNDPIEDIDLKAQYQGEMLDMLDKGDLDGAEKKETDINKLSAQGTGGSGTGGDSSAGGGGDSDASGGGGQLGDLIDGIRGQIMDDPTDTNRVPGLVEALGVLGDPNLADMEEYLDRYGADRSIMDSVDNAKLSAQNSELNPKDEGDGDGKDGKDGKGVRVSDEDIMRAIEGALGKAFGNLSDDDKAAIVAACTRFERDRSVEDIGSFGRRVQTQALGEDNPYFYHQLVIDPTVPYVNLAAIDRPRIQTGLRYVKRGRKATMAQYGQSETSYLTFTVGEKSVTQNIFKTMEDGTIEKTKKELPELSRNAIQQDDEYIRGSLARNYVYIPEADCRTLLGITCEYTTRTEYAVFITSGIQSNAVKIYDAIDELVTGIEEKQNKDQKTEDQNTEDQGQEQSAQDQQTTKPAEDAA